MDQDWYLVLAVPRDATPEQIKAAYRELALVHHPDRNPHDADAAKRFQRVQQAYDALMDPAERAEHDRDLALRAGRAWRPSAGAPAAPPASWKPPPPAKPHERRRNLTDREITNRLLIGAGAVLAIRGFLGAYVAPQSPQLERWLYLGGGQEKNFIVLFAGIALALFGLGR